MPPFSVSRPGFWLNELPADHPRSKINVTCEPTPYPVDLFADLKAQKLRAPKPVTIKRTTYCIIGLVCRGATTQRRKNAKTRDGPCRLFVSARGDGSSGCHGLCEGCATKEGELQKNAEQKRRRLDAAPAVVPSELVDWLAKAAELYQKERGVSFEQALQQVCDRAQQLSLGRQIGPLERGCIIATFFTERWWQPQQEHIAALRIAVLRHAWRDLADATTMPLKEVSATAEARGSGTCRVELKVSFDADFGNQAAHDEITSLGVADRLAGWADLAFADVVGAATPSALSAAFDAFLKSGLQDTLREQLKDPATKHRLCDLVRASLAQPPQARAHRGGRGGATDGITAPPPTST